VIAHLGGVFIAVAGPHPTAVPLVIVMGLAGAATLALVVVMTRDPGPGPADVAAAYEQAWDDLDFAVLWRLSAPELRDDRSLDDFVRDKRAAYQSGTHLRHLARASTPVGVTIDAVDPTMARVTMAVDLRDGARVVNDVHLVRSDGLWRVSAYHLSDPPATHTPPSDSARPEARPAP
jgi:hypothetical protein